MRKILPVLALAAALIPMLATAGDVIVEWGPTPIPRGDARAAGDLTVRTERFAIAFAAETAPPWGVARGGIVDLALVHNGEIGYDIVSLADFLPNSWTSWPTTYQRVTIAKQTADEVVVKVERDWQEVELETLVTVRNDENSIHMLTRMTNAGDSDLTALTSGYALWPDGGTIFGLPGVSGANSGSEDDARADWSAAYAENWVLGLHAPYAEVFGDGGQDRYLRHSLEKGADRSFEAWLQIEADGSLAPLVAAEIALRGLDSGRVSGTVRSRKGALIDRPAAVVYRDGEPYAWTIGKRGRYELELPVGDYDIHATASGYSKGSPQRVQVRDGSATQLDFADVDPPGTVKFRVSDAESGLPLDARISLREGPRPLIAWFGRSTLFTELHDKGIATARLAPGDYTFEVSAAGGFTTQPQTIEQVVVPSQSETIKVEILQLAAPREKGWYSADLHHHSDVLDGNTEAEYVLRSELAAGVDIAFLSDHDSVVNNAEMQRLAATRGILFMAGTEMSPSWAHFNAFPLDAGKEIDIDTGRASVQEIFAAARRMGADLIEANHPFMGYGYFNSRAKELIPGGYDSGFELVEIEALYHEGAAARNEQTVAAVWDMWNRGEKKYLAAGSDAHDVWVEPSGAARTYVFIPGELSIDSYVQGLKAGRAYASQGPLVYPELMFGSEVAHPAGTDLKLQYSVQAVTGLRSVALISRGETVADLGFDGERTLQPVEFSVRPSISGWYSLVIEDRDHNRAYTNPVWVTVTDSGGGD